MFSVRLQAGEGDGNYKVVPVEVERDVVSDHSHPDAVKMDKTTRCCCAMQCKRFCEPERALWELSLEDRPPAVNLTDEWKRLLLSARKNASLPVLSLRVPR